LSTGYLYFLNVKGCWPVLNFGWGCLLRMRLVQRIEKKAAAPTAPLMRLGMAGGTTHTADAAEDDGEDESLLVIDLVMLDMVEWEINDITVDCVQ
jgi:hypothetical protein